MKYADISRDHRALLRIPYCETDTHRNDVYWTAVEGFKVRLRSALGDDVLLRKLTKPQLLNVIAWCSRHRPIEPHALISTLGKLAPVNANDTD